MKSLLKYRSEAIKMEFYKYNLDVDNILWVTNFAAVSRGKSKSNNPEVRYKSLLKEGVGNQPSRPLELLPRIIPITHKNSHLSHFLPKYKDYYLGNERAVIKENQSYIDAENVKEILESYVVFKFKIPNYMWEQLAIQPIGTMISSSARVVKFLSDKKPPKEFNYYQHPFSLIERDVVIGGYLLDNKFINSIYSLKTVPELYELGRVMDMLITKYQSVNPTIKKRIRLSNDKVKPLSIVTGFNPNDIVVYRDGDVVTAELDIPLFVAHHIVTHKSCNYDVSIIDNEYWYPYDAYDLIPESLFELTNKMVFEYSIEETFKKLPYKKEIYQRYPFLARTVHFKMDCDLSKPYSLFHMLEERNVINYNKNNWTQQETTIVLKMIYDKLVEEELIFPI